MNNRLCYMRLCTTLFSLFLPLLEWIPTFVQANEIWGMLVAHLRVCRLPTRDTAMDCRPVYALIDTGAEWSAVGVELNIWLQRRSKPEECLKFVKFVIHPREEKHHSEVLDVVAEESSRVDNYKVPFFEERITPAKGLAGELIERKWWEHPDDASYRLSLLLGIHEVNRLGLTHPAGKPLEFHSSFLNTQLYAGRLTFTRKYPPGVPIFAVKLRHSNGSFRRLPFRPSANFENAEPVQIDEEKVQSFLHDPSQKAQIEQIIDEGNVFKNRKMLNNADDVLAFLQKDSLHQVARVTVCKSKDSLSEEEQKRPYEDFCRKDVFALIDSGHNAITVDQELAVALRLIERGSKEGVQPGNTQFDSEDREGEFAPGVKLWINGKTLTGVVALGPMHFEISILDTVLVPDKAAFEALAVQGGEHAADRPDAIGESLHFTRVVPTICLGIELNALIDWTSYPTHYDGYTVTDYKEMGYVLAGHGSLPDKWTQLYQEAFNGKARDGEEKEELYQKLHWRGDDPILTV